MTAWEIISLSAFITMLLGAFLIATSATKGGSCSRVCKMETKFNFKSAVCTSREQSERLLALGLKKETADMVYRSYGYIIDEFGNKERRFKEPAIVVEGWESKYDIPAWSLHRLVSTLVNNGIIITFIDNIVIIERYKDFQKSYEFWDDLYDNLIDGIEWLIQQGYFNKEYLV